MKTIVQGLVEVGWVVHEAATCSAEGERWPNYKRETDFLGDFLALQKRASRAAFTNPHAYFNHFEPEFLSVFGGFYRLYVHANHGHVVFFPNTRFVAVDG